MSPLLWKKFQGPMVMGVKEIPVLQPFLSHAQCIAVYSKLQETALWKDRQS